MATGLPLLAEFNFDVAISFLHQDLGIATELHQRLIDGLRVFLYTREQKDLAGTDGTESFRAVFRSRSRLVVVLYRDGWGATPFTRVEYEAITDRFLKEGAEFLFFVNFLPPAPWQDQESPATTRRAIMIGDRIPVIILILVIIFIIWRFVSRRRR